VRSYDLAWALEELRRREPAVIWLAAAGLFALAAAIFVDRHFIGEPVPLFWDLPVYDAAVRALAEGADPYNSAELHRFGPPDYLHFTSPPAIAWLLTLIAKSGLGPLLKPALLVLHLAAMVGITLVLGRLFFGREPERLALAGAALLMLFGAFGVGTLAAANNGTALYWWIVATAVAGFERDRWTAFHVAVLVAAAFKPFYAFFWMLPVLAQGLSFRHGGIAAAGALVAAASYVIPVLVDPATFWHWLENVTRQTLAQGDLGSNVFAAASRLTAAQHAAWLPYAAQLAFNGILLGLVWLTPVKGRARWAMLIIAAVFMNPRAQGYDMAIASIPLAFAAALLLPASLSTGLALVVSVYGLALPMLVLSYRLIALVPAPILFPLVVALVLLGTDLAMRLKVWKLRN
jgi:hypothetical protein